jgi:hypothetical protein
MTTGKPIADFEDCRFQIAGGRVLSALHSAFDICDAWGLGSRRRVRGLSAVASLMAACLPERPTTRRWVVPDHVKERGAGRRQSLTTEYSAIRPFGFAQGRPEHRRRTIVV